MTRIRAAGAITSARRTRRSSAPDRRPSTRCSARRAIPYDVDEDVRRQQRRRGDGRSPAAWCRSPTAATPAARSAIPPAFCNVVGLRPSPGRVPSESTSWSPLVGVRTDGAHGRRRRAVPERDRRPGSAQPALDPGGPGARFRGAARARLQGRARRVVAGARRHSRSSRRSAASSTPIARCSRISAASSRRRSRTSPASTRRSRCCATPPITRSTRRSSGERPEWVKDTIKFEVAAGRAADRRPTSARALARQARMYDQSRQFFERYDYFVLPVTQVAPFDVNTPYPTEIAGTPMSDLHRLDAVVLVRDASCRNPAISVPAGFTASGLPVGLQIVGRHRDEWSVLQLAHAFEQATRHGRTPAVAPRWSLVDGERRHTPRFERARHVGGDARELAPAPARSRLRRRRAARRRDRRSGCGPRSGCGRRR